MRAPDGWRCSTGISRARRPSRMPPPTRCRNARQAPHPVGKVPLFGMSRPRLYLEIALICLAAILLEVSYTRVFSFKLVYYFTYVIIGLALLGLGAGGVLVALLSGLRRATPQRLLPVLALLGGLFVLLGYFVVARVQLNAFDLIQEAFAGEPRF